MEPIGNKLTCEVVLNSTNKCRCRRRLYYIGNQQFILYLLLQSYNNNRVIGEEDYTGMHLWPCSKILTEFLLQFPSDNSTSVLEIAAGATGLPGLSLINSTKYNVKRMVWTEHNPDVRKALEVNVLLNSYLRITSNNNNGCLTSVVCDTNEKFDLVIASDAIYPSSDIQEFWKSVSECLKPTGRVYVCHVFRPYPRTNAALIQTAISNYGLTLVNVHLPISSKFQRQYPLIRILQFEKHGISCFQGFLPHCMTRKRQCDDEGDNTKLLQEWVDSIWE